MATSTSVLLVVLIALRSSSSRTADERPVVLSRATPDRDRFDRSAVLGSFASPRTNFEDQLRGPTSVSEVGPSARVPPHRLLATCCLAYCLGQSLRPLEAP